jgi:hypothetical protein
MEWEFRSPEFEKSRLSKFKKSFDYEKALTQNGLSILDTNFHLKLKSGSNMEVKDNLVHWRYFLSLERDVAVLRNYIEITDRNFDTYSIEIFKILQLACSEVDSVLRVICNKIDPTTDYHDATTFTGNISLYKKTVLRRFPNIHKTEILIPGLPHPIKPWGEWGNSKSPDWWNEYNKAKHYRHSSFSYANLRNMLMAMAALMVSILYLYRISENKAKANPFPLPQFFGSKYTSPLFACAPDSELPDFA